MTKQPKQAMTKDEALLKAHQAHMGLYVRVARQLGVDQSYVSRVARGQRKSEKTMRAILAELAKIRESEC